jgi:hypothetical protein
VAQRAFREWFVDLYGYRLGQSGWVNPTAVVSALKTAMGKTESELLARNSQRLAVVLDGLVLVSPTPEAAAGQKTVPSLMGPAIEVALRRAKGLDEAGAVNAVMALHPFCAGLDQATLESEREALSARLLEASVPADRVFLERVEQLLLGQQVWLLAPTMSAEIAQRVCQNLSEYRAQAGPEAETKCSRDNGYVLRAIARSLAPNVKKPGQYVGAWWSQMVGVYLKNRSPELFEHTHKETDSVLRKYFSRDHCARLESITGALYSPLALRTFTREGAVSDFLEFQTCQDRPQGIHDLGRARSLGFGIAWFTPELEILRSLQTGDGSPFAQLDPSFTKLLEDGLAEFALGGCLGNAKAWLDWSREVADQEVLKAHLASLDRLLQQHESRHSISFEDLTVADYLRACSQQGAQILAGQSLGQAGPAFMKGLASGLDQSGLSASRVEADLAELLGTMAQLMSAAAPAQARRSLKRYLLERQQTYSVYSPSFWSRSAASLRQALGTHLDGPTLAVVEPFLQELSEVGQWWSEAALAYAPFSAEKTQPKFSPIPGEDGQWRRLFSAALVLRAAGAQTGAWTQMVSGLPIGRRADFLPKLQSLGHLLEGEHCQPLRQCLTILEDVKALDLQWQSLLARWPEDSELVWGDLSAGLENFARWRGTYCLLRAGWPMEETDSGMPTLALGLPNAVAEALFSASEGSWKGLKQRLAVLLQGQPRLHRDLESGLGELYRLIQDRTKLKDACALADQHQLSDSDRRILGQAARLGWAGGAKALPEGHRSVAPETYSRLCRLAAASTLPDQVLHALCGFESRSRADARTKGAQPRPFTTLVPQDLARGGVEFFGWHGYLSPRCLWAGILEKGEGVGEEAWLGPLQTSYRFALADLKISRAATETLPAQVPALMASVKELALDADDAVAVKNFLGVQAELWGLLPDLLARFETMRYLAEAWHRPLKWTTLVDSLQRGWANTAPAAGARWAGFLQKLASLESPLQEIAGLSRSLQSPDSVAFSSADRRTLLACLGAHLQEQLDPAQQGAYFDYLLHGLPKVQGGLGALMRRARTHLVDQDLAPLLRQLERFETHTQAAAWIEALPRSGRGQDLAARLPGLSAEQLDLLLPRLGRATLLGPQFSPSQLGIPLATWAAPAATLLDLDSDQAERLRSACVNCLADLGQSYDVGSAFAAWARFARHEKSLSETWAQSALRSPNNFQIAALRSLVRRLLIADATGEPGDLGSLEFYKSWVLPMSGNAESKAHKEAAEVAIRAVPGERGSGVKAFREALLARLKGHPEVVASLSRPFAESASAKKGWWGRISDSFEGMLNG